MIDGRLLSDLGEPMVFVLAAEGELFGRCVEEMLLSVGIKK